MVVNAIVVENVSKSFGKHKVLDQLNLEVKKGEIIGILGPNGAGKSTLINILSTILKPDDGMVYINGFNLRKNTLEIKKHISIVPQEFIFYEELTARENLLFFGKMHSKSNKNLLVESEYILRRLGLDSRTDKVKNFSGGLKRRVNIAISLIMGTDIIFLDEPTTGLDPEAKIEIWKYLKELKFFTKTVLLLTHDMFEAENICDRIYIFHNGHIVAEGSPDELISKFSKKYAVEVIFKEIHSFNDFLKHIQVNSEFSFVLFEEEKKINIYFGGPLLDLFNLMNKYDFLNLDKIERINLRQTSLEDIFIKLTGRGLT